MTGPSDADGGYTTEQSTERQNNLLAAIAKAVSETGGAELQIVFANLDVTTMTKVIAPAEHEPSQAEFAFSAELCALHP